MRISEASASITAEAALAIVDAASSAANDRGKAMCIAVVDASGTLKAFKRMDSAPLLAVQLSQDKAYTSVAFGIPTDQWYEFIKDDPPLLNGIVHTPRLTIFGGGYPIVEDDVIIGAVGVSGGHYSDDMAVAQAGIAALEVAGGGDS